MDIKIQTQLLSLVTKKSINFEKISLRNYLIDDNFPKYSFNLKIFSPSEPIGILILFIGLTFTAMIFYIIYAVSTNKESLEDKKIRTKKESLQKEKIGKLFPKKK